MRATALLPLNGNAKRMHEGEDTSMLAEQGNSPPTPWQWPAVDQPVNVEPLVLYEWKHAGDSPIIAARPRKQRGAPRPAPAYLLKVGRDAIGERLYSLAARHFELPSAVVTWTTASDLYEAAIRFEPDAWRPQRLDPEQGWQPPRDRRCPYATP